MSYLPSTKQQNCLSYQNCVTTRAILLHRLHIDVRTYLRSQLRKYSHIPIVIAEPATPQLHKLLPERRSSRNQENAPQYSPSGRAPSLHHNVRLPKSPRQKPRSSNLREANYKALTERRSRGRQQKRSESGRAAWGAGVGYKPAAGSDDEVIANGAANIGSSRRNRRCRSMTRTFVPLPLWRHFHDHWPSSIPSACASFWVPCDIRDAFRKNRHCFQNRPHLPLYIHFTARNLQECVDNVGTVYSD